MCFSSPDIPAPVALQDSKPADTVNMAARKKAGQANAGGTLLTGPSGIATAAMNLGGNTLLGS
jgi:hypothetical protein